MVEKQIKKIIWIIFIAGFVLYILRPASETAWSMWMGFVNPNYQSDMLKKWEDKNTKFLIGKLSHPSLFYSSVASSILARRSRDFQQEYKLVNIVKSNFIIFPHVKSAALGVLFAWNEPAAMSLSMEILRSGKKHPLYKDALLHLSRRKYEPAYPYVLDLAKSPDPMATAAVKYLEDYAKPEAIPILEEMLAKVRTQDELVAQIDRRRILEAIESIKKQNNLSDQNPQGVSSGHP